MSESSNDPVRDLLEGEHSLWDVVRLARQVPRRYDHLWISGVAFLVFFTGNALAHSSLSALGTQIRDASNAIFQFVASILGIVVAAFAIFSTVSTSDIVLPFARHKREQPAVPELKYLALHFVKAFIPYLAFMPVHAFVLAFGWRGGPARELFATFSPDNAHWIAVVLLALLCTYLIHLLVVLQTLVFNVYKAFMAMAAAKTSMMLADEDDDEDCGQAALGEGERHDEAH